MALLFKFICRKYIFSIYILLLFKFFLKAIFPYSYIDMGKIREHTNQMREKCVELHKSGNGYKSTRLKMAI